MARLKAGARPEQAKAELQAIASDLEKAFPLANKGRSFHPAATAGIEHRRRTSATNSNVPGS